jgi:peptidoglycan/LPS O-acetylase OafA/YrhL
MGRWPALDGVRGLAIILVMEVPLTVLLAHGSYRLVERPFLRARERLPGARQEPSGRGEYATLAEASPPRATGPA